MPTIREKIRFNYDGIWSDTRNLKSVTLDNSMYTDILVASREIKETESRGNGKPLFQGVTTSPLEFEMTIAFEDRFTDSDIEDIIEWLFPDYYKPLYFESKEDRIFMAMPVSDSSLVHNGLKQGYFTIVMRCDSSYLYSPTILTETYTITPSSPLELTIDNDGHYVVYPEFSLYINNSGHIEIISLDDDGDIFEIRDLVKGEDIYLNSEKEIIETDAIGVYRYDNLIGDFPRLKKGRNRFKISGDCTIQVRYKKRYKY